MKMSNTMIKALGSLMLLVAVLLPQGAVWGQSTIEINSDDDFVSNLITNHRLNNSSVKCIIKHDIDASRFGAGDMIEDFSGEFVAEIDTNTNMPYRIKDLKFPLFKNINGGAHVHDLVLEGVNITSGDANGNAGAIACVAEGVSRVYNVGILSGKIGSSSGASRYVGGLVGLLRQGARVVNCYSFATITAGNHVAGIVGYNNETTNAGGIKTMVMNCMFYGNITGGSTKSPVYGGRIITNLKHGSDRNQDGLNTFNFYANDSLKTSTIGDDANFKCALAVEGRYLTRHEFYRLLLNSNKKLAAIYVTGDAGDADKMLKWVLDTADRTMKAADRKPYPVLKKQGYYPSIINPDIAHAPDSATVGRNKGGKLGRTLTVYITEVGDNAPSGAAINGGRVSLTLDRTDKDFDRYNFNYDKVQLPYYDEVGTGNYSDYRVVTGWKITAINGGNLGEYKEGDDWGCYNFADRNCTAKDLYDGTETYDHSGRVFSQGAYWDVPYGVTDITIEPYWGKAAYLADQYYDVVYDGGYGSQEIQLASGPGRQVPDAATYNGQTINTSIKTAVGTINNASIGGVGAGSTVYDNAIVLVGNYHRAGVPDAPNGQTVPALTIMSIDEDQDHEPDYSMIFHNKSRDNVQKLRFDFINIPGTAQAQKPWGTATFCNTAVLNPKNGWLEITNTTLIYFSQFECLNDVNNTKGPIILQGGVYDQFVSTKTSKVEKIAYLHVGGNAWFHDFGNGTHSDGSDMTKHIPISVTGGEYEGFYLTGTYKPSAAVYNDDAECYISGGHFGEAAGAGQEQIGGSVRWQIYNADIDNFFGGGTNDDKPIKGDVTVDIYNSHVGLFCGGPKFGNMQAGKKVVTRATGCEFGTFFAAGYGGTSYSRLKYFDLSSVDFNAWQNHYYNVSNGSGDRGKYYDGHTTKAAQDSGKDYGKKGPGVATDFDYEFFIWTSGTTGGRFFVKFASFSLAQCNDVSDTLKHCHILGNFYGGGRLGKVIGKVNSVLESCTVDTNVFGAGYSATLPKINMRMAGFASDDGGTTFKVPSVNKYAGVFVNGEVSDAVEFEWANVGDSVSLSNGSASGSNFTYKKVYTDVDLTTLGTVDNDIELILKGNTLVKGNVFGGGAMSGVIKSVGSSGTGSTTVTLMENAQVEGDVFGGGDQGEVAGSSQVIIQ